MKEWLERFEAFLSSIPLERYREELVPIKTVEQDLPKDLNPLPSIYASYWLPETAKFPDYEEFFNKWWNHWMLLFASIFGAVRMSSSTWALKPASTEHLFQCSRSSIFPTLGWHIALFL